MKKVLMSLFTIAIVGALIGGGAVAYFSDVETAEDNVFTAGTIDISLDPSDGQDVTTVEGDLDLKPCQVGYTYSCIHNDGTNPCEVWKHIANVDNREHGITDAEAKFYADNPGSENWLMSNWIYYDLLAFRSLGYSWSGEVMATTKGGEEVPIEIEVEDGDCVITWTIDFPIDDDPGNGIMEVGLVIALDGEGEGPAFQIHNHSWEGTGPLDAGTWCYTDWYGLDQGYYGWLTGEGNDDYQTLIDDLPWVTCNGERKHDNNHEGVFTITIDKCRLVPELHWALFTNIGSGFHNFSTQYLTTPEAAAWNAPIVGADNYVYAEIAELLQEVPFADGFTMTGTNGVECEWVYLGELEPCEYLCVIQSYHLDRNVENWAQSDRVFFDMEFLAQQIEGDTLPPAPGPVLDDYGRP